MSAVLNLSTDELLTTTRAVRRRFDFDRPVPLELVYECIELALQAPNGSNSQDWHFIVVTDAAKRRRLGELTLGDSVTEADNYLARVPVHVVPCITSMKDGKPRFSIPAPLYGSILPAAWSFCLAARSRGLGTHWTTRALVRAEESAELLGIPDTVTQVAVIPVGYTIGTDFKPGPRHPAEDVVHLNGW